MTVSASEVAVGPHRHGCFPSFTAGALDAQHVAAGLGSTQGLGRISHVDYGSFRTGAAVVPVATMSGWSALERTRMASHSFASLPVVDQPPLGHRRFFVNGANCANNLTIAQVLADLIRRPFPGHEVAGVVAED